jgi:hypothetical protein
MIGGMVLMITECGCASWFGRIGKICLGQTEPNLSTSRRLLLGAFELFGAIAGLN